MKKHSFATRKNAAGKAVSGRGNRFLQVLTRIALLFSLVVSVVACLLGFMLLRQPGSGGAAAVVAIADQADPPGISGVSTAIPVRTRDDVPPEQESTATSLPEYLMTEQDAGACIAPIAEKVGVRTGPKVYRWTDGNGRTVFGDRPPAEVLATVMEVETPSRMDYFDMQISSRGAGSLTFLQDRLQANVTATYETLAGLVGQERLRKVDLQIVVFPDRDTYLDYALAVTGSDMSLTNGFYTSATNEAVTYLQGSESDTLEVARHEATHVIIRAMLGDPPPWLNEGLAEYFSMLTVTGTYHQVAIQPQRLEEARSAIAGGYLPTLSSILIMRSQQWNGDEVSRNYAMAWGLVFFLMNTEQGRVSMAALLDAYADNYCTRLSSRRLLDESWPGGLDVLQEDFFNWLLEAGEKRSQVF